MKKVILLILISLPLTIAKADTQRYKIFKEALELMNDVPSDIFINSLPVFNDNTKASNLRNYDILTSWMKAKDIKNYQIAVDRIPEEASDEERYLVLKICSDIDFKIGHPYPIVAAEIIPRICLHPRSQIFSDEELRNALTEFPSEPSGVKYFGDIGQNKYTDLELEKQVFLISYFLASERIRFAEVYSELPEEVKAKFKKDTRDPSEASKVEPFDLIAHQTTRNYLNFRSGYNFSTNSPMRFIQRSKFVKKALVQIFEVSRDEDPKHFQTPSLTIEHGKQDFNFLCVHGYGNNEPFDALKQHEALRFFYDDGILIDGDLNLAPAELHGVNFEIKCGGELFKVELKNKIPVVLPHPKPIQLGERVDFLMTLALTEEIDAKTLSLFKTSMVLEGWIFGHTKIVETETKFKELFLSADSYLPVTHSMDINHFNIGNKYSKYLVFKKYYGGKSVYLHVLAPTKKNGGRFMMTANELAELYKLRRQNQKDPLFLLNISCEAAGTLLGWMNIYALSIEGLNPVPKDAPYIVASWNFFDTSSTMALATHMGYPLEAIRIFSETANPSLVVNRLKTPVVTRTIKLLSVKANIFGEEKNKPSPQAFNPVYNITEPDMFNFSGIEVYVTLQDGSVLKY